MKKISLLLLLLSALLTGCSTEKPQEQPEIVKQIEDEVKKMGEQYYVVITVDRK